MKNLIIFDLDGVITSEESYWDCAGLTLHELLYSPRYWNLAESTPYHPAATALESRMISRATLPEWLILSFKARALNSNWDTCYAAVCLHLIALLSRLPRSADLRPFQPEDAAWLAKLRQQIAEENPGLAWINHMHTAWSEEHPFDLPVFADTTGLELFERLDAFASATLGYTVEGVFARSQPFWRFCQDLFQEWLLGDALYTSTHGHPPAQPDKPGCLFFEEPLLPVERIRATLEKLQERGYTLGVASGRVLQEAAKPLEKYGLLPFFTQKHMGTYDVVTRGEKELRRQNHMTTMLGKPHPFHFQAAVDWERALHNALYNTREPLPTPFIVVGDSTSDILGGRAAGALTVAVLTGARTPEARELFLKSQPDFVIEDMTELPALLEKSENLATIQKLQFERREVAEKLLRLWFAREMDLATESVRLTPKAVSLNSFNGFYTSEGHEAFFKTHVEEHGVLNEYYNSLLLHQAGYNVVRPVHQRSEKERQMVIYPVITLPVMFDLMRAQETGQTLPADITAEALLEAERAECRHLLEIYAHTLQLEQDASAAPVHQLFWHRLTKRFYEFYADKTILLPESRGNESITFAQLMNKRWLINGVEQEMTLDELVTLGQRVLNPKRVAATVVGHGDAHFGNVFLSFQTRKGDETGVAATTTNGAQSALYSSQSLNQIEPAQMSQEIAYKYLYFDPAFAGHHPPLLDIVKPLFHNIFAMWMYFPQEIARDLRISVSIEDERIRVEHNYHLTPIRRAMLQIKQNELLTPLLAFLREQHALPAEWHHILNLALMCCPLLTVDLFDTAKRPPEIGWLGLSQALQIGNGGLAAWKEEQ